MLAAEAIRAALPGGWDAKVRVAVAVAVEPMRAEAVDGSLPSSVRKLLP